MTRAAVLLGDSVQYKDDFGPEFVTIAAATHRCIREET